MTLVLAIPYLAAAPAMLITGWHSDKTGERRWHAATAALVAGIALALSQHAGGSPPLAIAMFTLAAMGVLSYYPAYWALPTRLLSERSAAAGFGFVNLIANFGGFVGPYAVGFLTDRTGAYSAGVYFLVFTAVSSGFVLIFLPRER